MNSTKRIFIAVNLPDGVRQGIYGKLSRKIPKEASNVVDAENLHITMRFLGYMDEARLKVLERKIEELKDVKEFDLVLSGIGEFNKRVIWVGVSKGIEEMGEINKRLDSITGIKDERFHLHVTIARNKKMRAGEVRTLLDVLKKENYEASVKVKSIEIMESILGRTGPEYRVVKSVKLAGGGG